VADKNVLPKDKELYKARKVFDNKWAYGMSVVPINADKSLLIDRVEENDSVDGAPCLCYYQVVVPETVIKLN